MRQSHLFRIVDLDFTEFGYHTPWASFMEKEHRAVSLELEDQALQEICLCQHGSQRCGLAPVLGLPAPHLLEADTDSSPHPLQPVVTGRESESVSVVP